MDTKAVFCNLFIMKKELFEEYSSFCFGVLEEVEKRNMGLIVVTHNIHLARKIATDIVNLSAIKSEHQKEDG